MLKNVKMVMYILYIFIYIAHQSFFFFQKKMISLLIILNIMLSNKNIQLSAIGRPCVSFTGIAPDQQPMND